MAILSHYFGYLQALRWYSLDLSNRWHAASAGQPHPDILLIDIDDVSLTSLAPELGSWPWPRSVYAYLIEGLQPYQVQSWVIDVLLTEADKDRPDDDAFWIETASRQPNLFLSAVILPAGQGEAIPAAALPAGLALQKGAAEQRITALWPLGFHALPERVGMINAVPDEDGIFRRYPLRHSLAALEASAHKRQDNAAGEQWVFAAMPWRVAGADQGRTLPQQQELWLTFQGTEAVPYPSISFVKAFQLALAPQAEYAEVFRNKILIVGSSAVGLADLKNTAIAPQQPGMVLLATAIDNLLQQNALHRQSDSWLLLLLCWQLAGLLLLYKKQTGFGRFCISSAGWTLLNGLLLLTSLPVFMQIGWLFASGPIWLWLLLSFAGFNTLAALREYLQRQHTTRLFGRFLDPRVVASLVGQNQIGAAEKCQITVLFTDIRGFTSLSEQLDATEVMALLNRYFAMQVNTLFEYNATLDKFIGDAIMAFWGAPLTQPNQADLALQAATAMVENLQQFKASLPAALRQFDIGIGIHTGEAVVGMLGTEQRLEYTAIGDTVNIASRLESVSKTYGRVLCSEQTRQALTAEYPLYSVGAVQLKGRQASIQIYRLGD
ncbi:adenylate/guanylate cyclase domain-containing protein [Alishewanella longhuensis]|uniref:Adenylate/guanylate cyclase domain-containing protein n=2 Tax=Alishewanella longhuensis TaxID=1091037 RepID=A0ABQ3KVK9_9ALTE|nr:adenylate/guanylate cyclase domain-containing protein [Alishewanella longhuensis]